MKNSELNKLSINELIDLNKRLISIIKDKRQIESLIKKSSLEVGMRVKYTGTSSKLINETFKIEKINKVNVVCISEKNNQGWNIKAYNLKEIA